MLTSEFDYDLPKDLIAQVPKEPRDHSRLMILDRDNRIKKHDRFYNLGKYLGEGDVLVFNNSRVFPARLHMQKETGGEVEVFLLNNTKGNEWEVLTKGKIKPGAKLVLEKKDNRLEGEMIERLDDGRALVRFECDGEFFDVIENMGETPLPPYIKTEDSPDIREKYQTIYARDRGSVAAPTAGLHFTPDLIKRLEGKGVVMEYVTLHVGMGTFQPVKDDKIEDHQIHSEYAKLDGDTALRLNAYRKEGRRIIAVGTTSCRLLEAFADKDGNLEAQGKWVDIFIYPGYKWKIVDGLMTNFHLPKSTLLMLVSALAEKDFVLESYKEAIDEKYRFYSFGDGMLIL